MLHWAYILGLSEETLRFKLAALVPLQAAGQRIGKDLPSFLLVQVVFLSLVKCY